MSEENDLPELVVPAELPEGHRSGFVAVIGHPNVGKSTLMNAYLGQKVAIVSPKPQTTRDRLLGILTLERARGDLADAQIIFVDTPGIHDPLHKLGEYMVQTALRAIPDADLVLFLVDASQLPNDEDRHIAAVLGRHPGVPTVLVIASMRITWPRYGIGCVPLNASSMTWPLTTPLSMETGSRPSEIL